LEQLKEMRYHYQQETEEKGLKEVVVVGEVQQ
jgi:hypothetical protein